MGPLEREMLLREVVKALVEEGGEATIARLYYRLHNRIAISYYEFAEEVKKSGRFAVTRPPGWENDLVSLKPLEPNRGPERVNGGRAEPLRIAPSPCRGCEHGE